MTTHTARIPIKTVSEANQSRHAHWGHKQRRAKKQRKWTRLVLSASSLPKGFPARSVLLTRIGPKQLDKDNLASALKAVQDEVAAFLGVDDNPDSGVTFDYSQHPGSKDYAVLVEVSDAAEEG